MKTRRRESLIPKKYNRPDTDSEAELGNRGKPKRGQETKSKYSRRGGGSTTWGVSANTTGSMAAAQSMVQGCS